MSEVWNKLSEQAGGKGLTDEEIDNIPDALAEGENSGSKNEAWIFEESLNRQRDAIEGYWTVKKKEITELWKSLTNEEQYDKLDEVRKLLTSIANGIYQETLLYCPELNPNNLSKNIASDKTKHCFNSFIDLIEFCNSLQRLPAKQSVKNRKETIVKLNDPAFGDNLIFAIVKKIKQNENLNHLPLIALTRHHLLFTFCHLVIAKLLHVNIANVTENLPGCTDLNENRSPGEDLNLPFSSKAQREATPISKPPPPKVLTKLSEDNSSVTVSEVNESPSDTVENSQPSETRTDKCAEPSCNNRRNQEGIKFKVCSRCNKKKIYVPYCSAECQVKHWPEHKKVCST